MWPHGKRAGCIQVCKQMGHSNTFVVAVAAVEAAAAAAADDDDDDEGF